MKKYFIQTFGCAMNQADSEKINMIFLQSGFIKVPNWKQADVVIFNTCSVRQKGEDRVFGLSEEIYKFNTLMNENNNSLQKNKILVGITGCMVRKTGINKQYLEEDSSRDKNKSKKINLLTNKEGIFNYDDKLFPRLGDKLDFTLRIEETKYLPLMLTHILGESIGNDSKFDDYLKSKQLRENSSQANVIIQTGCDNYCSFCIVPYTRGGELSRTPDEILEECREAVKNGAKEITLIGQNVNSYGKQFVDKKLWNEEKSRWKIAKPLSGIRTPSQEQRAKNSTFTSPFRELLDNINSIEGLDRIRFTSSNPHDMTQDILDSHIELKNNCNYLHFALQSGSDNMLKRMNRKHSYSDFKKQVDYLRNKDPFFSISTDIIVGYSGETEEMFQETVKAFKECDFDFCFTARYSVRKGTLADRMYPDDVDNEVKARRWHILNDLLLKSVQKRNTLMLGREEEVLISGEKDGQFYGRTRNFKEVFFIKNSVNKIGDIVKVKILSLDKFVLIGEQI
ncbi:MiaB/RimO family radical SAM methylthiotransferase [Candidatus Gracilibacteria bacterium]|nr:MiaB/RimO family radical SAM methylthiotransferase [Candidatus Gracilibacteria bacterium]